MKFTYMTFQTEHEKYLFDGVSNRIFNITDEIFHNHKELFDYLSKGAGIDTIPENLKEAYTQLYDSFRSGYLLPNNYGRLDYWFEEAEVGDKIESSLSNLIIELTQRCNMRCRYCVYSGHYDSTRVHGTRRMELAQVKKAIDYFISHSYDTKEPVINFYGGEPFYEFDVMKEAVDYIRKRRPEIDICITTNGLLLKKEVIEWFAGHDNISLLVSLAGIPEVHDKLRVTAGNAPTFQAIRENLMYAREYDYQAYVKRINFIFNIFDEVQLKEIQDFWDTDELFEGLEFLPEVSFIDMDDKDGYIRELRKEILCRYQSDTDPLDLYISYLKQEEYNNIIVSFYDKRFLVLHNRSFDNKNAYLCGVCRPMLNRVFADIDGNIGICENMRFSSELGDINSGINSGNVSRILADYKQHRKEKCPDCWAVNICQACFKDVYTDNIDNVDKDKSDYNCANERGLKKEYLKEYCRVLEEGEQLLDHLYSYEAAE